VTKPELLVAKEKMLVTLVTMYLVLLIGCRKKKSNFTGFSETESVDFAEIFRANSSFATALLLSPSWHSRFNLSCMPMVPNSFKGEVKFLVQGNNHQSSLL